MLHYSTTTDQWPIHDFFRRLYYLPIILGAFYFHLKGAFYICLAVLVLYAPHMVFYFGKLNIEIINQSLEGLMFLVIGLITGYLVEKDYKKRQLLENQLVLITNLKHDNQNVLDSLESGVIALDQNLEVKSMNRRAKELFEEAAALKTFFIEAQLVSSLEKVAMGTLKNLEQELWRVCTAGDERMLRLQCFPMGRMTEGKDGIVVIIDDLTQLKLLEKQVKRNERLTALGQFATGIAHEIRNPLAIIKTLCQTLDKEGLNQEAQEVMEIMAQEVDRANHVILELMDYASPGKMEMTALDLGPLLAEVTSSLQAYGERMGSTVVLEGDSEALMWGNPYKLKQALINLGLNGIQAMKGQGQLTLSYYVGEVLQITFKDQGPGIPQHLIEQLFNPFFTTKDKGVGLGLTITHQIVQAHGGSIDIFSEMGMGTTVLLKFPLLQGEGQE